MSALTETFLKWFTIYHAWCIIGGEFHTHALDTPMPLVNPTKYSWIPTQFAAGNFSRTKVFDTYSLVERGFNFPNMAFFETKSKTDTEMRMKHFGNVLSPKLLQKRK